MNNAIQYRCGVRIDETLCKKCGTCCKVCPADIFSFDPATRTLKVEYPDECMYCGACMLDCPADGAIQFDMPMTCL